MATVMTSRQYSPGQPSLPARNQQSNVTHVKLGSISSQSSNNLQNNGRSQPLNTHPPGSRRASEGVVRPAQDAVPPLPNRIAPRVPPMRRQSFETNSFIDRNTAKAFSDPKRVKQTQPSNTTTPREGARAPAPGSQGLSTTVPRNFHTQDDEPPLLPTSRPPSRRPSSSDTSQLSPTSNPPSRKQHPNQEMIASLSAHLASQAASQQQAHQSDGMPERHAPLVPNASHPAQRRQTHRSEPIPGVSPELPPSRPPKTSLSDTYIDSERALAPCRPPTSRLHSVSSDNEFEERYRFHEPNDFPAPDKSKISRKKAYPSLSDSVRRKSEFIERDDTLGPL